MRSGNACCFDRKVRVSRGVLRSGEVHVTTGTLRSLATEVGSAGRLTVTSRSPLGLAPDTGLDAEVHVTARRPTCPSNYRYQSNYRRYSPSF